MRWGSTRELAFGALQAFDPEYSDEAFVENLYRCSDWLYYLCQREVLSVPHVEITHTFTGKPFDNEDAEPAGELSLLGYYHIVYENGEEDTVAVHTDDNIGVSLPVVEPELQPRSYHYSKGVSKYIGRTLGAAALQRIGEETYYTFAVPARHSVREVFYEPVCRAHAVKIARIAVKA